MFRKLSAKVLVFVMLLAPVTIALTWKAKSLEKKLFGRSDEMRLMNKQAPEFKLMTLTGDQISSSDYRGKKKLVVSFWASWCGPCRMELPELQAFYEKYHSKNHSFEILAISTDEDPHEAERYVKEAKLTFPVLWDQDGKAGEAYGVDGIPTLFVIDESGRVIHAQAGYGFGLEFKLAQFLGIQPEFKGTGNSHADTSD
jgi:peroxiredoxin